MDEIRKDAIDEQARGKLENLKGKIKEGAGKLTGDRDLEAEGQARSGGRHHSRQGR